MDPIRTAVKFSLIPLRTIVQLGDLYVAAGEDRIAPEPEPAPVRTEQPARAAAKPKPKPRARKASPQASQRPKDLDDVSLARKVESIIFRDDDVPKGDIDVNAADGVVWLRGEAKTPEMIKELERQTLAIPEVKQVENLLHLPKTPAPTRSDTPPTQRKTRSNPRSQNNRKVVVP
jgi:hypothetical protein